MVFFCGFDILNIICYASFDQGDFFIPQISFRFLGWELWDATVDIFTKKTPLPVPRLWVLWTFFTDREGVGADLENLLTFSQALSKALLLTTAAAPKFPCSFSAFSPGHRALAQGSGTPCFQLQGWGWERMEASQGVPALSGSGVQDICIHSLKVLWKSDFCFTSQYA